MNSQANTDCRKCSLTSMSEREVDFFIFQLLFSFYNIFFHTKPPLKQYQMQEKENHSV